MIIGPNRLALITESGVAEGNIVANVTIEPHIKSIITSEPLQNTPITPLVENVIADIPFLPTTTTNQSIQIFTKNLLFYLDQPTNIKSICSTKFEEKPWRHSPAFTDNPYL